MTPSSSFSRAMRSASTFTSPMSLRITAICRSPGFASRWFTNVVFPAPRYPLRTVTGIRSSRVMYPVFSRAARMKRSIRRVRSSGAAPRLPSRRARGGQLRRLRSRPGDDRGSRLERDGDAAVGVRFSVDVRVVVNPRDQAHRVVRHRQHQPFFLPLGELGFHAVAELCDAGSGPRRHGDRIRREPRERGAFVRQLAGVEPVDLVEDGDDRRLVALVERVVAGDELLAHLGDGLARVHHEQHEVRAVHRIERRLERLDEPVGQVRDEPDGVGEQHVAFVHLRPARRRPERGEQHVLRLGGRRQVRVAVVVLVDGEFGRQLSHQRGFAGVGVARQRDQVEPGVAALLTAGLFFLCDRFQLVADLRYLAFDVALDALVVLAEPHEPGALVALREAGFRLRARKLVPQLREFDLELCLSGVRPLAEYLEDEREPVDHLDPRGELSADVERLVGADVVVDHDAVGLAGANQLA